MTAATSRQRPATGARYLDELTALLWPAPAATAIGPQASAGHPVATEEYVVLPNACRPRLVVPGHARAAAAAVRGFNPGRSRRARLLSGPLSLALRAGAGGALIGDGLGVQDAAGSLRRYLSDVLGDDVLISFQLGPPRANRKPVVQLLDHRGRCLGYAKLGVNDLTRKLVRHEAAALNTLARAGTRAVSVPGVRHLGRWHDADVLVLDPLPPRRLPAVRPGAGLLRAAMAEIAGISGLTRAPLAESPYWGRLLAGLEATGSAGAEFGEVLGLVGRRLGGTVLAFGCWHGDWTRSNVAPRGRTVLAWDWERFGAGVPAGFDALHYHLHNAIRTAHHPPERAVRGTVAGAGGLLETFGVPARSASARLTAVLYLAELALRYLRDRQDTAGARLGEPGRWLLPGLAAVAGELASEPDWLRAPRRRAGGSA